MIGFMDSLERPRIPVTRALPREDRGHFSLGLCFDDFGAVAEVEVDGLETSMFDNGVCEGSTLDWRVCEGLGCRGDPADECPEEARACVGSTDEFPEERQSL